MKKKPRNKNVRCVVYPHQAYHGMRYGAERREAILDHCIAGGVVYINRRYQPQMSTDPDLKYMVRKGILKQGRTGGRCRKIWKESGSHTSYLYLPK